MIETAPPIASASVSQGAVARWWPHALLVLAGGLGVLVALYYFAFAPAQPSKSLAAKIALVAPPPTPVPVIEPMEIKVVAPEEAEAINAAVPFSTAPNPAAKPFKLIGSENDMARATDCLAAAIYYEAGNEAIEGQRAVAQVVLNRVRHPAFPKTVCGVVFQGQERTTGCQFSFSCDGSMARIPVPQSWARLQVLARAALTGSVYKPVGLATHYHTNWVVPVWSASLEKIDAERTHLFFRWSGWWGTPPAFRGNYAGGEPSIGKLSGVSLVHQAIDGNGINGVIIDSVTGLPLPALAGRPVSVSNSVPRFVNAAGDFKIFLIDRHSDPQRLAILAQSACTGRQYCKILMWVDGASVPSALPVSDAQLAKLSFSYLRNTNSGYDKALWNCALFTSANPDNCMTPRAPDRPPIDRTAKRAASKPRSEPESPPTSTSAPPPADLPARHARF